MTWKRATARQRNIHIAHYDAHCEMQGVVCPTLEAYLHGMVVAREEEIQDLVHALLGMVEMCDVALPKFDWGGSFLDAQAIKLLNDRPIEANRVLLKYGYEKKT
jgi:hypothetical protein